MDLICTHRDFDGVVSAALLARASKPNYGADERVSIFSYGETYKLVNLVARGCWGRVYVLDFSLDDKHLTALSRCPSPITYVDHHLTSLRCLEKMEGSLDEVVVDPDYCTVELVCQHWTTDLPEDIVTSWQRLARVRDFGLEAEESRDARLINFIALARPYELFSDVLSGLAPSQVLSRRKQVWQRREEGLQRALALAEFSKHTFTIGDTPCCLVFTTSDSQDVALHFLKSFPIVFVGLILFHRESLPISLRTTLEGLDLSKVAEALGGGGHAKAAGFVYKPTAEDTFDTICSHLATKVSPLILEQGGV